MKTQVKKLLQGAGLAASVATALAACAAEPPPAAQSAATAANTVHCKESNSCKGNATCSGLAGGEKHGCKGTNKCAGNLRELSKAECDTIKGTVVN